MTVKEEVAVKKKKVTDKKKVTEDVTSEEIDIPVSISILTFI
jgi:stress response protein YsnF